MSEEAEIGTQPSAINWTQKLKLTQNIQDIFNPPVITAREEPHPHLDDAAD